MSDREHAGKQYAFFTNKDCEYFPCHTGVAEENFNCLFCYCPLYILGNKCGGNFFYTERCIKVCKHCSFPHHKDNYSMMLQKIRSHVLPRARDCPTDRPDKFPPGLSLHGKASSFHLILYMPDSRQSPVGFFSD